MKKDIKKKSAITAMLSAFAFGLCIVCPWIQASTAEARVDAASVGNIIYENEGDSVAIYTEDISLLKNTLSSVRAEVYDPASYGHVHKWEYTDITESTHTEQCLQCSSSEKLVNAHTEASKEKCVIAYDGNDYPGCRYLCACGYEWLRERYHTPVYTPIDSSFHAVTCALHGTAYCDGMGEIEEEHISMLRPTDGNHHRSVCEYCKYEGEEQTCVFDIEDLLEKDGITQTCWYCECGNCLPEAEELSTTTLETAEPGETPPISLQDEAKEDNPDTQEEESGKGTPETQEKESGEETPETREDEPEKDLKGENPDPQEWTENQGSEGGNK